MTRRELAEALDHFQRGMAEAMALEFLQRVGLTTVDDIRSFQQNWPPSVVSRPRDSQRTRLYRAEEEALPYANTFDHLDQADDFIWDLTHTRWWRRRYPYLGGVTAEWASANKRAGSWLTLAATVDDSGIVEFNPEIVPTERVLIHELAHFATGQEFAGHGPEFARTYVELVRYCLGPTFGSALLRAFRRRRVKVAAPGAYQGARSVPWALNLMVRRVAVEQPEFASMIEEQILELLFRTY